MQKHRKPFPDLLVLPEYRIMGKNGAGDGVSDSLRCHTGQKPNLFVRQIRIHIRFRHNAEHAPWH